MHTNLNRHTFLTLTDQGVDNQGKPIYNKPNQTEENPVKAKKEAEKRQIEIRNKVRSKLLWRSETLKQWAEKKGVSPAVARWAFYTFIGTDKRPAKGEGAKICAMFMEEIE